jgi:uncharacterized RDD family membrane protein YckC
VLQTLQQPTAAASLWKNWHTTIQKIERGVPLVYFSFFILIDYWGLFPSESIRFAASIGPLICLGRWVGVCFVDTPLAEQSPT